VKRLAKRFGCPVELSLGLIEWQYIPLGSPLPLEFLFDPTVDVAEPFDRTKGAGKLEASAT
jgi:hypothetical protein